MGYRTYYNLNITNADGSDLGEERRAEIIDALRGENEEAEYSFNEAGEAEEENTWYEHVKEMAEFSKKYPDVLFCLEGEGEESHDLWEKYFLNGKVQLCPAKIEFDEFDEAELQEVSKDM
jgi:hypothetical protein